MLVIGCIINNVVGLNLYDSQLFEVLEIHQWEVGITRDANINEMIGADQGHMELRSSILSLYFIHKNKLYQDVIQIMRKMIWNSDRLISISNISELFYRNKFDMNSVGKEGLRDEILNYFGNISDVTYYKKNQFFWLQYAMACMDLNKYEMAENCFKLAYKYASEKHIQSFQIYSMEDFYWKRDVLLNWMVKKHLRYLKKHIICGRGCYTIVRQIVIMYISSYLYMNYLYINI